MIFNLKIPNSFNKVSAMRVDLCIYAEFTIEMIIFYTPTLDSAGDICGNLKVALANTQQFYQWQGT